MTSTLSAIRLSALALCVLLTSCATPPTQTGDTFEHINKTLEEGANQPSGAPARSTPPPEVSQALLPPIKPSQPGVDAGLEQRFDVVVNNAPAQQFFMSLVESTPYNMLVHPQVSGG